MTSPYGLKQMARDLLNGTLQISPAEIAEERIKTCRECDHFQSLISRCSLCGCLMAVKTKMLEAACPADKW